MYPTAITQITEQIIKLAFGVLLVRVLLPNIKVSVAGATFAITLSEIIALVEIFIIYKIYNKKNNIIGNFDKKEFKNHVKKILKICIPVTITSIMIPLSQVIDSFLIINVLKAYSENATSLYGLLSGTAMSVVNLPVSVCYGISVAIIPLISKLTANKKSKSSKKSERFSIVLTLAFAILPYSFK